MGGSFILHNEQIPALRANKINVSTLCAYHTFGSSIFAPASNCGDVWWYWLGGSSPSLRSVWTVCWQWTRSCWSSRTLIWVRSFRMHRWVRRTRQRLLPPLEKPGSIIACGFSPTCGSACTSTGSPYWRCLTGTCAYVLSIFLQSRCLIFVSVVIWFDSQEPWGSRECVGGGARGPGGLPGFSAAGRRLLHWHLGLSVLPRHCKLPIFFVKSEYLNSKPIWWTHTTAANVMMHWVISHVLRLTECSTRLVIPATRKW